MKRFNARILAIGVLALAAIVVQVGAQEGYQQGPPAQSYQQYQYQHSSHSAPRRLYDSPLGVQQNHKTLREQFNPSNLNYGVVMDGWHDAVLLMTVKSIEWWLCVISLIALAAVGFDDLYRMKRAKDIIEATAGAAQIWLNDRSYCLRRANEAIVLHNELTVAGNTQTLEVDAMNRSAAQLAIRSIAIQAAEMAPILEGESPLAAPVAGNRLVLGSSLSETGDDIHVEQEFGADAMEDVEPSTAGDSNIEANVQYSTLECGGKKYKVPTPVRLSVQAKDRKIENQRIKINQLEERLRQYEKD